MEDSLDTRARTVLLAVAEQFIRSGQPVGSSTVTESLPERVSPATVRNVMAELERDGYLSQPHTSAGRVPTARGYRAYTESLFEHGRVEEVDTAHLRDRLTAEPLRIGALLQRACRLLADLTEEVGVVLKPAMADMVFQHVDLVRLEGDRILVILVGRNGRVSNEIISMRGEISQAELDRISDYLVCRFAGRSLREVSLRMHEIQDTGEGASEVPTERALELGVRTFDTAVETGELVVEGAEHLIGKPEFRAPDKLLAVLTAIEQSDTFVRVLEDGKSGEGTRVLIGSKRLPRGLGDCTVIMARYGVGDQPLGSLGLVGPNRMHYAKAIAVVEAVARETSAMMTELEH